MIEAAAFVENARTRGFEWYAGVPCSFLTPFINYVISDPTLHYISSANEGDAVATASGVVLAGGRAIAMMQNSGLGNAVSPLTSLNQIFRIPVLLICTHRGAPGVADEPQHALMGQITGELFDTMRIPWQVFPNSAERIDVVLDAADQYLREERGPYALIMQKGTVAPYVLSEPVYSATTARSITRLHGFQRPNSARPSRRDVLKRIRQRTAGTGALLLATTGYTGRELFALGDHANQLYMVGSMGCVSSLGLGVSLLQSQRETVILDGDGAALMRMGNMASLGRYGGSNLTHIVLDNEVHDSTGGQATVSASVDFAGIAAKCGYATVVNGDDPALVDAVVGDTGLPGPRFLHIKTRPGTIDDLPRPNSAPADVALRFMRYLQ